MEYFKTPTGRKNRGGKFSGDAVFVGGVIVVRLISVMEN